MKRLSVSVLALCMLFVMMVVPAKAAVITDAERVLLKEGVEAFLQMVTPKGPGQNYVQEGYAELKVWSPDGPVVAEESDEFAAQVNYTVAMQETNGVGFTVECVKSFFYVPRGDVIQSAHTAFEDRHAYVPAYGRFEYGAGGPRGGNPRYEIVAVRGTDDNGHELEFYGIIERLNFTDVESVGSVVETDGQHDTENLRYNADYEVQVAEGVWWVPTVSLGQSRYTNADIASQVQNKPEEKKEQIGTLYEALQLFQIGNFANADDNQRISEGEIHWEHHKPGYDAVRTNEGCCASDSNWLNYILDGDYEQVGFLAYSQSDGGGHILNYIFNDGFYYFIDLTHYRTDFLDSSAPETGKINDYYDSDFISGNFHKAVSPEAYVDYCRAAYNDPPELFFLYQAPDCLAVDGVHGQDGVCITYENTADVKVVFDDPNDALTYAFVEPPEEAFNWSALPDAEFRVDEKYLDKEAEPDEQDDFFKVGDVISLVDYGDKANFAEINGEDYFLAGMNGHSGVSFEEDIFLYGGCRFSYLGYELPVHEHEEALESMESVRLGELMTDLMGECENIRIARCIEQDGALTVTDVIGRDHYFEPVYARKGEDGRWMSTDTIWYVFHYEIDGEIFKEFGRFGCRGN